MIELFFDLIIGGLIIGGAITIFDLAFTFYWPLPTQEMIDNYQPELFSINPQTMIFHFLGNVLLGSGLVIIGIGIPLMSVKLRAKILKSNAISEMCSRNWMLNYFDSKIKQASIGKWFAVGYLSFMGVLYIYNKLFIRVNSANSEAALQLPMNSVELNLFITRFAWLVLFPIAIYFVASWQKKRWLQRKQVAIESLAFDTDTDPDTDTI